MTEEENPARPSTMPENVSFHMQGLDAEFGRTLAHTIGAAMRQLGQVIDVAKLDGVTVAVDYEEALATLDRGYETSHVLTPSEGIVVGVAMTPAVLRDGELKSHIVLNANYGHMLGEFDHEFWPEAFHLVAHECAHVDVNAAFDKAFPGTLLRTAYDNAVNAYLGEIVSACWDEYAACRLSAGLGADPLAGYMETVEKVLASTRADANRRILEYRTHGDHDLVLREVMGSYGDLMKYVSYMLGHMDGIGFGLDDVPSVRELLSGHWFELFFERQWEALKAIAAKYGNWTNREEFDDLEAIIVEVVGDGGIELYWTGDGGAGFNAPFTLDTVPPHGHALIFGQYGST